MTDRQLLNRPIIFGEVLFDIFPDGKKVLGGAPFNVAWHLTAFAQSPLFVSRIGDDELGKNILNVIQQWNMCADEIQIDSQHSTGQVRIIKQGNTHGFEIAPDQAFDFISPPQSPFTSNATSSLLYFGSLCLRNDTSRESLEKLLDLNTKIFVDINLRAPWWNKETISFCIEKADWLKINDDELKSLFGNFQHIETAIENFFQQHQLEGLVVTCGEKGAYIYNGKQLFFDTPPIVNHLQDTVGAGDAFTAVFINGILQQWPMEKCLEHALAFAAAICEIQGATTTDKSFYDNFITRWSA